MNIDPKDIPIIITAINGVILLLAGAYVNRRVTETKAHEQEGSAAESISHGAKDIIDTYRVAIVEPLRLKVTRYNEATEHYLFPIVEPDYPKEVAKARRIIEGVSGELKEKQHDAL